MEQVLSKSFLKELCSYYMEFLETDFKASRIPSRRIKPEHRKIGLWHFPKYPVNYFELADIPYNHYVSFLPEKEIDKIVHNPEKARELLSSYDLEEEKILKVERKKNDEDFKDWLSEFAVQDFYSDFLSLVRDRELEEGLEIYLYIGRITYQGQSFPLFYGKLQVTQEDRSFKLALTGEELFFNKKAIAYCVDRFRKEAGAAVFPLPNRRLVIDSNIKETTQEIVHSLCDYFGLDSVDLASREKHTSPKKDQPVHITHDWMLTLFDKSDESIVNDYEQLLLMLEEAESEEELAAFSRLLTSFVYENPISIDSLVSAAYEEIPLSDKFTYQQPVPLNAEQHQLLSALGHPDGKYLVVEGPPGTGKSHTITAVIFDSLLKGKSVLMVSDKQEALDVVESKINDTLDSMKLDEFVQNPVLRLGKQNNNFHKILNQMNIDKIKTRQQTFRKKKNEMSEKLSHLKEKIETQIEEERLHGKALDGEHLTQHLNYEEIYENTWKEWTKLGNPQKVYQDALILKAQKSIFERLGFHIPTELDNWKRLFADKLEAFKRLRSHQVKHQVTFVFDQDITKDNLKVLKESLASFENLKKPIIGYLFQGSNINKIEENLSRTFFKEDIDLKTQAPSLEKETLFFGLCEKLGEEEKIDFFSLVRKKEFLSLLQEMESANREFGVITDLSILESPYMEARDKDITHLEQFLTYQETMNKTGNNLLRHDFIGNRKEMDNLLVCQMTNLLDEQVVGFMEHNRKDASLIRSLLKKRKPLPEELLRPLIEAFPCLIVGIREIGDYLPFSLGLFDIVIIDEASQVSIAQAFPAILRAKQVVVLGDTKQFGNVKSHQATGDVNRVLFKRVKDVFAESHEGYLEERIEQFNIKNSILEFIRSMANYHTTLKKHFRGYSELIGYSNRSFYDDSLQVMKIRAKPISEVIEFYNLESEKRDIRKNTNSNEADFILEQLDRLKNHGFEGTIGIITPFREQQKYLSDKISESTDAHYYRTRFHLKVMTFDSCQGEERDIIYYSMVERKGEDSLKYIFPVNFSENEDNLKAQRLNVGFSRVKEKAVFVLSKPVTEIRGEAGNALRTFFQFLEAKDHVALHKELDPKSQMEEKVLQWITETRFYKEDNEHIEIIPQFAIGAYMRQIDPTVVIPSYRVDFLILYGNKSTIVEYDGYEFHFKEGANRDNYQILYTDEDIERQKTIECYGYRFIRLNKFIARENPIGYLDQAFQKHFASAKITSSFLKDASKVYQKIEKKEMKTCEKCGEVKELEDFHDPRLKTGYGRVCNACKKSKIHK